MGAPLYLWARAHVPRAGLRGRRGWLPAVIESRALGAVVLSGRLLAAGVEVWAVQRHLRELLAEDVKRLGEAANGSSGGGNGSSGRRLPAPRSAGVKAS